MGDPFSGKNEEEILKQAEEAEREDEENFPDDEGDDEGGDNGAGADGAGGGNQQGDPETGGENSGGTSAPDPDPDPAPDPAPDPDPAPSVDNPSSSGGGNQQDERPAQHERPQPEEPADADDAPVANPAPAMSDDGATGGNAGNVEPAPELNPAEDGDHELATDPFIYQYRLSLTADLAEDGATPYLFLFDPSDNPYTNKTTPPLRADIDAAGLDEAIEGLDGIEWAYVAEQGAGDFDIYIITSDEGGKLKALNLDSLGDFGPPPVDVPPAADDEGPIQHYYRLSFDATDGEGNPPAYTDETIEDLDEAIAGVDGIGERKAEVIEGGDDDLLVIVTAPEGFDLREADLPLLGDAVISSLIDPMA